MIFVNSTSELQYNNLCFKEKPYYQPVITEHDIALQGFLPKQLQNEYSIEIQLLSADGDEIIADVTSDFEVLFGISIYNQNYFNIRLKTFDNHFSNVECFILKVVVKNAGFKIFDKITEPYRKLVNSKTCYAVIDDFAMMIINKSGYIKVNNQTFPFGQGIQNAGFSIDYVDGNYFIFVSCKDIVEIGYCYQGQDNVIAIPLTASSTVTQDGCSLPLMRIESSYNCKDNIMGGYYGDPKILLNYPGNVKTLKHSNNSYIYAEIETQPTEIKRESTKNGKPQRVEYVQKFGLVGLESFPRWKMIEIESLFSGRRVFVNGIEYIFRGGTIFKKSDVKGSCSFRLEAELENVPRYNDFNCLDDCTTNCTYFVIPDGVKDQNYYDENRQLIGETYQDLIDFFSRQSDVISVLDIPVPDLLCDVLAVIKIDSFGLMPSYIYYKLPTNEYRTFAKYDSCDIPTRLCEGLPRCAKPKNITSTFSNYIACAEVPNGVTSYFTDIDAYEILQPIEFYNNWTADSILIKKFSNMISIDFVLSHPTITDYDNLNGANIMKIPFNPQVEISATYDDAIFYIDNTGVISAYGNTLNNKLKLSKIFPL